MPESAVTLQAIADHLGLSKATVSRALSDHPRVAVATRERVAAAARELGYQPDATLRALARRRWPDGRRPDHNRVLYLHDLRRDTRQRMARYREIAANAGYDLEEAHLDRIDDPRDFARSVDARNVRGVVIHLIDDRYHALPRFRRCARVMIGFGPDDLPLHRVTPDLSHNLRQVVDEATARGYCRIGFVATETRSGSRDRLLGEQCTLRRKELQQALGPQPGIHWVDRHGDDRDLLRWIQREAPDAVVCDRVELCQALRACGTELPRDLGLVAVMNRSRVARGDPFTQISQRRPTVFRHALGILHDMLLREEYATPQVPVRVLIPGRWHEGLTLPPR